MLIRRRDYTCLIHSKSDYGVFFCNQVSFVSLHFIISYGGSCGWNVVRLMACQHRGPVFMSTILARQSKKMRIRDLSELVKATAKYQFTYGVWSAKI